MMLAMMVATLSFLTACGGDDDDNIDIDKGDIIIVYNGNTFDYDEYGENLAPRYQARNAEGGEFIIFCPYDFAIFEITYPRETFGKLPSSSFKAGHIIDPNDVVLSFTDETSESFVAQYVSGSAKVVANDGESISVSFNNFKATSSTRDINIKKGIIKSIISYVCDNGDITTSTLMEEEPFAQYEWIDTFGQNFVAVRNYVNELHNLIA